MTITDFSIIEKTINSNRYGFSHWNECGQTSNDHIFSSSAAPGGTNDANTSAAIVVGHPGVIRMTLGTSTTGNASIRSVSAFCFLGNSWEWRYDAIVKLIALSDGTDTYTMRLGFIDSGTAESTDGVFFRYTHSVNGGKWQKVARNNSTETGSANDTTVTAQTSTYSHFAIVVNSAGDSAEFFIDGVSVGTETANIPTGASRQTGVGLMFLKSAGTTNNSVLDVDAQGVSGYSTTIR